MKQNERSEETMGRKRKIRGVRDKQADKLKKRVLRQYLMKQTRQEAKEIRKVQNKTRQETRKTDEKMR